MNSIKVDGISMSFQNLLAKICFYHHFSGKQCHSDITLGFIPEVTEAALPPPVSAFLHQALACSPECLLSTGLSSCVLAVLAGEGLPGSVDLTPLSVAVVERVDSCASMYSRSIQGHHVCLLVKKVSSQQCLLLCGHRGWVGFPCASRPVQGCPSRSPSQECNPSPTVVPGPPHTGPPGASRFGTQARGLPLGCAENCLRPWAVGYIPAISALWRQAGLLPSRQVEAT